MKNKPSPGLVQVSKEEWTEDLFLVFSICYNILAMNKNQLSKIIQISFESVSYLFFGDLNVNFKYFRISLWVVRIYLNKIYT